MSPENLLALLGLQDNEGIVLEALRAHRILRSPIVETYEASEDEGDYDEVINPRDFLLARRTGIEFGFESEASFLEGKLDPASLHRMLLTQIYFYGDHQGVGTYTSASLPHGIGLDEDRQAVRKRLSNFEASRRSWIRDTWDLPNYTLVVSYADGGNHIASVLCELPSPPSKASNDIFPIPKLDQMLRLLGRRMDDSELRRLLRPLHIDDRLTDIGPAVAAFMREDYGLDLRFGGVRSMDAIAFTNLIVYRDRELEATQWRGGLPRGLEWNDSPEVFFAKLGEPAKPPKEMDFDGRAVWHYAEYSLELHYSTVYNWILSARFMAPGVWEAFAS